MKSPAINRDFALLFMVMLTIAAGNTALQSVLPALGRSLKVADSAVAAAFSVSALLWVLAAPFWAKRSDRQGRRAMILLGVGGFSVSLILCGVFLAAGINGWISGTSGFHLLHRRAADLRDLRRGGTARGAGAGRRADKPRGADAGADAARLGLRAGHDPGPAIAPYLILGGIGSVEIGLSGPAFLFALFGAAMFVAVLRRLPNDLTPQPGTHGAANAYPSIGGQSSGASVTAATEPHSEHVSYKDPRIRAWMIAGLVMGHAQAMTGQAIGFLVIDRLHVAPAEALQPTGLVLMMGAGAALLVQWGIIPLLDLKPRQLILTGLVLASAGCAMTGLASSLYGIATAYALASIGFGFTRPGFTAGSSLAVGHAAQGSVAGKVTSINGAAFVLGPSIGVGAVRGAARAALSDSECRAGVAVRLCLDGAPRTLSRCPSGRGAGADRG